LEAAGSSRLDLTAGNGGMMVPPGRSPLPGSAVVEAPCVGLVLVVDSDGVAVRRELKCE
jgi:hypothetical protein